MSFISHYLRNTLVILLPFLVSIAAISQTLSPEQFGGRANDSEFDNGPSFVKMAQEAVLLSQAGQTPVMKLGSGIYHIWDKSLPRHQIFISNHDHHDDRAVAIWLEGAKNVSIVGENTQLHFHGRLIPFVFSNCESITLEGVTIDYPRPALSQITIHEVSEDYVRAEVLKETEWRIDNGRLIIECEGFDVIPTWTMPFSKDGHMKWNRADVGFSPKLVQRIDDSTILLHGWEEKDYLQSGDVYVLRSYGRPTPGIVVSDSRAVRLRDVVVHYAEGMGLLAQNSDDLTLDHFAVKLPENTQRRFTTQADATHFSGCRGYIRSTDGLYENMADDAINVHGTYLRVDNIRSPHQLEVSFAHSQTFGIGWFREGDEVTLIDRNTMKPIFTTTCLSYETLSPKEAIVTLSTPIPEDVVHSSAALALENSTAYPSVDFGYNTVRNNRARGALFSSRCRVTCHHNLFDHTHGSAILLSGDANGWFESGPCGEIIISDNHFINSLTALYQFTHAVISIDPVIRQRDPSFSFHGKVVIRDNTFTTFPSPLYYVESVEELILKNNRLQPTEDYAPIFKDFNSRIIH